MERKRKTGLLLNALVWRQFEVELMRYDGPRLANVYWIKELLRYAEEFHSETAAWPPRGEIGFDTIK